MDFLAVISGDIINSQDWETPDTWLHSLREALSFFGKEQEDWDIYWGDGFQVRLREPAGCFEGFLKIKSVLRSTPKLDARMGIGIAPIGTEAEQIKFSHGPAYVLAAKAMKNCNERSGLLHILSTDEILNDFTSACIPLVSSICDDWKPATASVVTDQLRFPGSTQSETAERSGIRQSTVNAHLHRSDLERLLRFESFFRAFVGERLHL
ncbi:MAG: hypothetical protein H6606_03975 [Flavobacteriales bacterium]|nr:hypothetical protein [Flavobacteriales bacterium]